MKFNSLVKFGAVAAVLLWSVTSFAQTWEFEAEHVSGQAGDTVEVQFTVSHVGAEEAFTADIHVSDMSLFSNVDTSSCMDNFPPDFIANCAVRPAPNDDTIRILWTSATAGDPWPASITGSLFFEIDAGAVAGAVADLEWDIITFNGVADTVDGSITVVDGPQSDLGADKAAIAFGTIDLGAFPVTDTVTFTNNGDPGSSLDITGAVIAGDAEFSITANGCAGATLNDGDSCTIEVEFDAVANGNFNAQLSVTSDANANPNHDIALSGTADSAPMLAGAIMGGNNLGAGQPGDTLSTVVNFTNTGSAADDVTCNIINDAAGAFGFNPAAPFPLTIGPNGGDGSFDLTCTLPAAANPGDIFTADLVCGGAVFGDVLDVEVSCRVAPARAAVPVPTMQKWSLVLLSLLMLVVGGLSVRFFRA